MPISIHTIYAGKFRRFSSLTTLQQILNIGPNLKNLRDFFLVIAGFFQSLALLIMNRPDVIFFKGGFVVVPIGYAARLLRIPYVTHDSDAVPGLANRLIARGAIVNTVSSDLVDYYPKNKSKSVGIPINSIYYDKKYTNKVACREKLGIKLGIKVLFVFLGTQGAKKVDEALELGMHTLLARQPDLVVFHVFGRLNESEFESRYSSLPVAMRNRVRSLKFVENAHEYIAASDLVLGRAGATSVAEFAALKAACIIVPADQLTGEHQVRNAEVLAAAGAVKVVREKDMAKTLVDQISVLLDSPKARNILSANIAKLAVPDSALRLAHILLNTARSSPRKTL